jgi:hypothetical protein
MKLKEAMQKSDFEEPARAHPTTVNMKKNPTPSYQNPMKQHLFANEE